MRQDEAERLARELKARPLLPSVERLCDHILSGDRKCEIENAAFERVCEIMAGIPLRPSDRAAVREAIRKLITPAKTDAEER